MIIAQISDTHIDPEDPNAASRIGDLERCVMDINGLDPQPDMVIHTGDVTHNGTAAKYTEAMRILGRLNCPLHVAAGNRDDRALIRSNFVAGRDILADTPYIQYCVDDYPVRLIALDTLSATTNMGDFCSIRADSLRRTLAENTAKPTALFMHHPPFEVRQSKYPWQFDSQDAIAMLGQALSGQSHVMRAFCGHAHRDASGAIAEVPTSCVPSVAVDLRLGDFPVAADAAPVYQVHTFDVRRGFTTALRIAS